MILTVGLWGIVGPAISIWSTREYRHICVSFIYGELYRPVVVHINILLTTLTSWRENEVARTPEVQQMNVATRNPDNRNVLIPTVSERVAHNLDGAMDRPYTSMERRDFSIARRDKTLKVGCCQNAFEVFQFLLLVCFYFRK